MKYFIIKEEKMSVPSKAKAVKLDNPTQIKVNHQSETELQRIAYNRDI